MKVRWQALHGRKRFSLLKKHPSEIDRSVLNNSKNIREKLLRAATPSELKLKAELTKFRVEFSFQKILFTFGDRFRVADFFFKRRHGKLVVEVDGGIHKKQRYQDLDRMDELKRSHHVKFLRFTNKKVFADIKNVMREILRWTKEDHLLPQENNIESECQVLDQQYQDILK